LIILALGQLASNSTAATGLMILMSGRSKIELANNILALTANTGLCLLLIPSYGLLGAALASMLAVMLLNLFRTIEVWFIFHMHAYDAGYLKPIFAGLIAAAVVLIVRTFLIPDFGVPGLVLFVVAFGIIYTVVLLLLGLNDRDKSVLRMTKARLTRANATK